MVYVTLQAWDCNLHLELDWLIRFDTCVCLRVSGIRVARG